MLLMISLLAIIPVVLRLDSLLFTLPHIPARTPNTLYTSELSVLFICCSSVHKANHISILEADIWTLVTPKSHFSSVALV